MSISDLYKIDKYARIEFSGLSESKVMCWVCYHDNRVKTGSSYGHNFEKAFSNAILEAIKS